jgi:ATP-dependent Clp protease ATP-binding subunit ClpA
VFERFSPSARATVVAARSEARRLRHQYVGTEHLLLGLVDAAREDGAHEASTTIAATVLSASGLNAGYIRSQIIRLVGDGANGLGDDEASALHSIGIDLDAVRSRLEESFGEGVLDRPGPEPSVSRMPFTAGAKKALALSVREARQLGSGSLKPEHILLGLIREGAGVAAMILTTKAPLPTLRERVLAELGTAV